MTIDLDKLEAFARSASQPGPWSIDARRPHYVDLNTYTLLLPDVDDAAYLAASSPEVALALIDEQRKLRAALDYTTTQLIGVVDFGGTSTDDYNIRTTARDLRETFDLRVGEWESRRKELGHG